MSNKSPEALEQENKELAQLVQQLEQQHQEMAAFIERSNLMNREMVLLVGYLLKEKLAGRVLLSIEELKAAQQPQYRWQVRVSPDRQFREYALEMIAPINAFDGSEPGLSRADRRRVQESGSLIVVPR